jgi:hypothetical protein
MNSPLTFLGIGQFLTIGILCILFPYKLQKFYLDYCEKRKLMNLFVKWVRTDAFIFQLRVCGIISFLVSLLFVSGLFFGTSQMR